MTTEPTELAQDTAILVTCAALVRGAIVELMADDTDGVPYNFTTYALLFAQRLGGPQRLDDAMTRLADQVGDDAALAAALDAACARTRAEVGEILLDAVERLTDGVEVNFGDRL